MARAKVQSQTGKNGRSDYIEHGSERHALFLGLRKATKEDEEELVLHGWTFVDFTQYGPMAQPRYLKALLRQKVNELKSKPAIPQSEDRQKPNYAPEMFDPDSFRKQSTSQEDVDQAIETLKQAGYRV